MSLAAWCFLLLCVAPAGAVVLRGTESSTTEAQIPSFDSFVQLHSRTYKAGSGEYAERRALYEQRAAAAKVHNSKQHRLWTAGVNYLWDWSEAELATLRGWRRSAKNFGQVGGTSSRSASGLNLFQNASRGGSSATAFPKEKHWPQLVATNYIHNQGGCGSCWAIAGATILEAHAEIHKGIKRTFSAQQLVSCVPNPQQCGGQGGCKGATVELAMDWVMHNRIAEEFEVPYAGADGTCSKGNSAAITVAQGASVTSFGMTGWGRLPENEYEPLMRAVVETGPVAVSAAASGWTSYASGVFDGCVLDAVIDHAIALIGYGEAEAVKYWTVQNSWGRHWGEGGRIRILRRDDDQSRCGVDRQPELGTGCIGGPEQVRVCGMCGILYDSVIPHFG